MPRLFNKSLTDVAVRKAEPREQRYDLYDAALRGFGIRVAISGTKSFFRMIKSGLHGRFTDFYLNNSR